MQTFKTPFSRAYWKAAALEMKDTRKLVFAALTVALMVALKSVRIPVYENLYITAGFLPNALGGMVYGPAVALVAGFASDTLGALLFPIGPYFPPFMAVEMLAALLFALFLYRARLAVWRVAVAKLLVNLLCNVVLTPLLLAWMNGTAAVLTSLPRIAKNVLLFPLEALLLALLLGAASPVLRRAGLPAADGALRLETRHYALLGGLLLVSVGAVCLYVRVILPLL